MNQNSKNGYGVVRPIHILLAAAIAATVIAGSVVSNSVKNIQKNSSRAVLSAQTNETDATLETATAEETVEGEEEVEETAALVYPTAVSTVEELDDSLILSQYSVLIDLGSNKIIAQRDPEAQLYPASMTKIMTLVVAMEHIDDYETKYTFTDEIIDPLAEQGAAMAGFSSGEEVTVKDLLYGCALPSGAEATTALAVLAAGSEADFVSMMNQKAKQLGLKNTHFVNCTGLHDPDHYTTAVDMALILEYAMQNEELKEIMSTYQYTTSSTDAHPDGILLESTMFEKMYGTEVEGLTILAGKTGFTNEAGYCLASYAEDKEGNKYICVTADSKGPKGAIYDTLNIYGTIADGYYNPTTEPVEETVTEQSGAGEQEVQQQEVQQQYVEEPVYVEPAQPEPAEEQPAVQEEPQVQEEPVDNGGYEDAGVDGI